MAVTATNHLPDSGFFFVRQALVEARLMSAKRACDAVYVATLAEELRNIEKKIAAFEQAHRSTIDESSTRIPPLPAPENSTDAEWIRRKARELELRLRGVEQASTHESVSGSNDAAKPSTSWRAVPRYPRAQGDVLNRKA
jgi:hypothetical protein